LIPRFCYPLNQIFEGKLVTAMKDDGWNGFEDENQTQWSLTGSLFYSIIVITTIGEFLLALQSIRLRPR
jgi:hypothetical protein